MLESLAESLRGTGDAIAILAGLLLVLAMLVGKIRHLRMLALAAGVVAVLWFALVTPNRTFLVLSLLFVLGNAIRLAILLRNSRPRAMRDEERKLLEHVLQVQDPAQQRYLLDVVEWRDCEEGEVLMTQGDSSPPLIYVASGAGSIEHDGHMVGVCGPGDFLGEMSMVTGEAASATVEVTNPMRVARFSRDGLSELTRNIPELKRAFDHAVNQGLAAKILRMNKAISAEQG